MFGTCSCVFYSCTCSCTCHSEPVHVVEQVDVTEDEDGQQRSDTRHAAGRLLLRPLTLRRPALLLRLAVIGEERRRVRRGLVQRHGRRWGRGSIQTVNTVRLSLQMHLGILKAKTQTRYKTNNSLNIKRIIYLIFLLLFQLKFVFIHQTETLTQILSNCPAS